MFLGYKSIMLKLRFENLKKYICSQFDQLQTAKEFESKPPACSTVGARELPYLERNRESVNELNKPV